MFRLKLKTDTALGRFRSVLLVFLVTTVSISALISIFGVVTDSFGDALSRVVATSSLFAVLSFAVLLQTFSLPRGRVVDRVNATLGIPATAFTGFTALDGLYDWRALDTWLGNQLAERVIVTFLAITLVTSASGLLLHVSRSKRSIRAAIFTSVLAWLLWLFTVLNNWFPDFFNRTVEYEWGSYQELHPFWQRSMTVVGILLAAMAVITFVLELVGIAHARRDAEGLTRLVGIDVELPADVRAQVAELAAAEGVSEAQYIARLVERHFQK